MGLADAVATAARPINNCVVGCWLAESIEKPPHPDRTECGGLGGKSEARAKRKTSSYLDGAISGIRSNSNLSIVVL